MNRTNCPHPRRAIQQRAATLMEVIASVGSITALAITVLPGLGEARRQSKEIHCISNMARIADATAVHAATDENEFAIPRHGLIGTSPPARGEYEWGGKSGAGDPQQGSDPISSKWGTQEGRGPWSRKINNILYKGGFVDFKNNAGPNLINWANDMILDISLFRCPGDYGFTGSHYTSWRDSKLTSFDHYGTSYAASTFWIGIPGPDCKLFSNTPFLRPVSRVPAPSRTVLFLENCGRFAWRQNYGIDGCGSLGTQDITVDPEIRAWHGAPFTFNVAFVDGRVARTAIDGYIHPPPVVGHYPDWAGQPTQPNFWTCVIVRGLGWQLDTLPNDVIPTGMSCSP